MAMAAIGSSCTESEGARVSEPVDEPQPVALDTADDGEDGMKVAVVVPAGVQPGDDILFTTADGRELNVRAELQ